MEVFKRFIKEFFIFYEAFKEGRLSLGLGFKVGVSWL